MERIYAEVHTQAYSDSPPTPIFNRFPSPPTETPRVSRVPSDIDNDCIGKRWLYVNVNYI